MMYFIMGIVIYLIWTAVGVWFFLSVMGHKYRKEKWYDKILLLPVMPIVYILAWVNKK
jgi:hypothetical protein